MSVARFHMVAMVVLGLAASALSSVCGEASAQERSQSVTVTADLDAGEWQGIRLRNLPSGAELDIELVTENALRAIVIDEDQFQKLPEVEWPLAAMTGEGTLRFTVVIREAGAYYLVLDNRQSGAANRVGVSIRASVQ